MDTRIRVDPEHFEYLRLQKGSLDHLTRGSAGRPALNPTWHAAYEADLLETYQAIAPHLPATCLNFLDVGSGLGGIDILIRRHYEERGQSPGLALLDGIDDKPEMILHRRTYNNMRIARNFQVKNGISALKLSGYGPGVEDQDEVFGERFDLVVSFGSWCFHYPPDLYLRQVAGALSPGAVVMLEVRRSKPEYLRQLCNTFGAAVEIESRPKWSRWLFHPAVK
jgi:SAM-dependent methyltransferase